MYTKRALPNTKKDQSEWIYTAQRLARGSRKGLTLNDHHDWDYYRRVNAKTVTSQNGKYSQHRNALLGPDYIDRHNKYKTQGDLRAGGKSGREWEDHKYLYKTKTKNGTIRYVYELPDKSKVSYEEGSEMDIMAEDSGRGKHHSNRYLKKRELFDEVYPHKLHMAVKELSKGRFNNARKFGNEFLQLTPTAIMLAGTRVKDAALDVIDSGKAFLNKFR